MGRGQLAEWGTLAVVVDVVNYVELLLLVGTTVPGLTDGKEDIGQWNEGSNPGTGYLGLPPIKGSPKSLCSL